jgi:multidrug efflux system membrane fusion protein
MCPFLYAQGTVTGQMASRTFTPSRLVAVALVVLAAAWILSGQLGGHTEKAPAPAKTAASTIPVQRVGVAAATPEQHKREVVLSCITKADHSASAVARASGVITDLKVTRGSKVRANDVIATISDEGRTASVAQAKAALDQAQLDYETKSKLIASGDVSRNTLASLQSAVAGAQAALAASQAEADRAFIRAPIDGTVDTVPVQLGQALQIGNEVATIVDPNPMLAVGAVNESRRTELKVGQPATVRFIDGAIVSGTIDFVSLSAEAATRTYRVEATMTNTDASIPDGVTCEMTVTLTSQEATAIPRSALVFSDAGQLGVRVADESNTVHFVPVGLVDDGRESVWVSGIEKPTRVIVVGQDFVKDGDVVEAVSAAAASAPKQQPPA